MARNKSDLQKLCELAIGWELSEYLYDRAARGWTWARIQEEVNAELGALFRLKTLPEKIKKRELFRVTNSNLSRWYRMFGVKSLARGGRK